MPSLSCHPALRVRHRARLRLQRQAVIPNPYHQGHAANPGAQAAYFRAQEALLLAIPPRRGRAGAGDGAGDGHGK